MAFLAPTPQLLKLHASDLAVALMCFGHEAPRAIQKLDRQEDGVARVRPEALQRGASNCVADSPIPSCTRKYRKLAIHMASKPYKGDIQWQVNMKALSGTCKGSP